MAETEVVENASELVELYNPAEIFASFAEAAREAAGMAAQPTAADELLDTAGIAPEETFTLGDDAAYAGAADDWAAGQPLVGDADDEESAALAIYNLALDFQERSQTSEARLIDQFEEAVARLAGRLGDLIIVDDDDERLVLGAGGRFRAEVLPEDSERPVARADRAPRRSSSSTTRPTSSATSPTRSPRRSRRWRPMARTTRARGGGATRPPATARTDGSRP